MTMWEFNSCVSGYNKAQGKRHSVVGDPMSDEAYEALSALGDMWNGAER